MTDIDQDDEARQRLLRYETWRTNPFTIELVEELKLHFSALKHAAHGDTTTLGVGGLLAREKTFGAYLTYESILEFLINDLPKLEDHRTLTKHSAK